MTENTEAPEEKKEDSLVPVGDSGALAGFGTKESFELLQRQAGILASSNLTPKEFKGNVADCSIALEMANRLGASPMAVMQNMYIVHGKPSWSSQFIIAAVNSTKKFSPLRFKITGEGKAKTCIAWAIEKETGERLESPPVSIDMAEKEGWSTKNGSKWKTMPELMLRYRSATFFGRLYAPEILMGMQASEEVSDIGSTDSGPSAESVTGRFDEKPVVESVEVVEEETPKPEPKKKAKAKPETPAGSTRDELMGEINKLNSKEEITQWEYDKVEIITAMSNDDKDIISGFISQRKSELEEAAE
ncbi:MAG: hypothetical protein KAR40_09520 [Candidatus Sabulitectum sp.]|nr:hypothetical protein [Candidatus Sabulitectum sp.]